ncbi:hypothetical protein [Lewinella sp. 4G2]|uniref:hypothetical protein n=1 Tax=Lewinella sp. 4G2 TaxID=1803372 RepID=UPI0012F89873|nr:hypothetical protein [Lewinella sp. 4G2]
MVILFSLQVYCTPQTGDMIIVNSDTIYLHSQLPIGPIQDVLHNEISYYEKNWSTGCYRGYYSVWQLKNDSLFFNSIVSCNFSNESSAPVSIHAHWVTQKVIAPIGKKYKYLHQGWGWLYEAERLFTFKNGILRHQKYLDNSKYHLAKIYEEPEVYNKFVLDNFELNKINTTEFNGKNGFTVLEVTIDESGFVKSSECSRPGMPSVCTEAKRIFQKIDRLSVYYENGKVLFGKYAFPFNYFIIRRWKGKE